LTEWFEGTTVLGAGKRVAVFDDAQVYTPEEYDRLPDVVASKAAKDRQSQEALTKEKAEAEVASKAEASQRAERDRRLQEEAQERDRAETEQGELREIAYDRRSLGSKPDWDVEGWASPVQQNRRFEAEAKASFDGNPGSKSEKEAYERAVSARKEAEAAHITVLTQVIADFEKRSGVYRSDRAKADCKGIVADLTKMKSDFEAEVKRREGATK